MAVDPVPYVVHGAKHSADIFRQAHYDATGGAHGISSVGALRVKQTGTPSTQVQVAPGGATILNSYSGGSGQSYSFRNASTTLVDVPASDSTGAKSWWIIACIEDPQFGGQAPATPESGPYSFLRCVAKNSTIAYPYELLAEIVVPASTATITNAMIASKREVARPRTKPELRTYALLAGDTTALTNTNAYPGGATWPVAVEEAWGEIPIPSWATRAKVIMMWTGVRTFDGNAFGGIWVQVGQTSNPDNRKTQYVAYNSANPSDVTRDVLVAADNIYIPAALRGTSQKFYPRGNRDSAGPGRFSLDGASSMVLQVEFMEQADE